mgnify:CR=1 FL=1
MRKQLYLALAAAVLLASPVFAIASASMMIVGIGWSPMVCCISEPVTTTVSTPASCANDALLASAAEAAPSNKER